MKCKHSCLSRALSALLIALLLLTCLPCAALAESYQAKVKVRRMEVLADLGGAKVATSLPKGTVVTVTAKSNGMAKIRYQGHTAYAQLADLSKLQGKEAKRSSALKGEKAYALIDTRFYRKANTASKSVRLPEGSAVIVQALKGKFVKVKKSGVVGYVKKRHLILASELPSEGGEMTREELEKLKEELEKEQKKKDKENKKKKEPSFEKAYKSGKYSNEQLCYLFAKQYLGYNIAATAGLLANINYESGFRVGAIGDNGSSYGLCQWHAARRTRLTNYCKNRNLEADSLLGQLAFLKYELETYYPSVHRYLKSVENSAQGAYDAAYYFCYNYEAPASRVSQSTKRGESARSTYFPRYAVL